MMTMPTFDNDDNADDNDNEQLNMLRMGRAQLSIKADVVCGDSKARPREIKRDARRVDLHKMRKHRNVTPVNILLTTKCK